METHRSQLLESIAADMGMLKDLEDKTLDLLQRSEGQYELLSLFSPVVN